MLLYSGVIDVRGIEMMGVTLARVETKEKNAGVTFALSGSVILGL